MSTSHSFDTELEAEIFRSRFNPALYSRSPVVYDEENNKWTFTTRYWNPN